MILTDDKLKYLEDRAKSIRRAIIERLVEARSGHTAGALGRADIFTALYFGILSQDVNKPDWAERDRVILSNGHICPVLYAVMAHSGYFPVEELLTLRKFGTRLQGHPHREFMPWLDTSSGPLGEGLGGFGGQTVQSGTARIADQAAFDKGLGEPGSEPAAPVAVIDGCRGDRLA